MGLPPSIQNLLLYFVIPPRLALGPTPLGPDVANTDKTPINSRHALYTYLHSIGVKVFLICKNEQKLGGEVCSGHGPEREELHEKIVTVCPLPLAS